MTSHMFRHKLGHPHKLVKNFKTSTPAPRCLKTRDFFQIHGVTIHERASHTGEKEIPTAQFKQILNVQANTYADVDAFSTLDLKMTAICEQSIWHPWMKQVILFYTISLYIL
jgi:hypothetical protein